MADKSKMNFGSGGNTKVRAWRDIRGSGQSVAGITDVPTASTLVDRLESEYNAALKRLETPAAQNRTARDRTSMETRVIAG